MWSKILAVLVHLPDALAICLTLSGVLRGLDKLVEMRIAKVGTLTSARWVALDNALDKADAAVGWFGDMVKGIVFSRRSAGV
jgi:hypothetical protein